ncbi:MAG: peptidylprolyl isomerase [Acidobacteria bacterium]|nr:peptidylprolyl isomerase [Acidobacteriota bacterium]
MLKVMRENVQSKFIKGLLWAVIFSFIAGVFLIWGSGSQGIQGNPNVIVKAGDVEMDRYEFGTRFQQYAKDAQDEQSRMMIANEIITQFIREQLWLKEADELGIVTSPDELYDTIMNFKDSAGNYIFRDKDGKLVEDAMYKRIIEGSGQSIAAFESGLKDEIKLRKLQNLLLIGIDVTDEEALDQYKLENEKVRLKIVKVSIDKLKDRVEVTDEALNSFYNEHKEDYRRPDSNKYEIVNIDLKKYLEGIEITSEEAYNYYTTHKDNYLEPAKRQARHILLKVPRDADAATAERIKAEADKVLEMVKSGEDFAAIATRVSEDTASAVNGGLLDYAAKGVYQPEFDEALWRMKNGEIVGPIKTVFGYHIIKLEDTRSSEYTKYVDVKNEIMEKLKEFKATEKRDADLERITEVLEDSKDWNKTAEKENLSFRQTEFFPQGGLPQGVPPSDKLMDFTVKSGVDSISEPIVNGDSILFLKIKEQKESHIPPMEEVRQDVESGYREEVAKSLAEKESADLADKIRAGTPIDEAVIASGLTVESLEPITRSGAIPGIGAIAELNYEAFNGRTGEVKGPFEYYNGYIIGQIEEKIDIDFNEFLRNSESYKSRLLQDKQNKALYANLEMMFREVKIETNTDLVMDIIK